MNSDIFGGGGTQSLTNRSKACRKENKCYNSDMKHHYYKKQGFTLAEVLITLGIIGIVAALALTTVIPEIQNKQNIAKLKKTYAVVSSALSEVIADDVLICEAYNRNGACVSNDNAYIGSFSEEFLPAIKKKLNVADYCEGSAEHRCDNDGTANRKKKWVGTHNAYSLYRALGVKSKSNPTGGSPYGVYSYNFNKLALLLQDGSVVYFGELWDGPWVVVDVNNFQKGPNEFGRDVFVFNIISNTKKNNHYLAPAGSDSIYVEHPSLNNPSNGITGCSKDIGQQTGTTVSSIAGVGCTAKYLLE